MSDNVQKEMMANSLNQAMVSPVVKVHWQEMLHVQNPHNHNNYYSPPYM